MIKKNIKKIKGKIKRDFRGSVTFINDFNFKGVKRFYQVENIDIKTIRAFHGHMKEEKYVYVVSGSILLCVVYLDNSATPSKKNRVKKIVLNADRPEIIHIPDRYANGFKALEENTKVIFFSTATLEESLQDDYRFPADYWGEQVWQ